MWETRHNSAGWDCFRTLTLLDILHTQNRLQEKFCAYLEVTRSCQQVGCARSKRQFHTFQRNLNLFLLMLVYARMEFPLLISGIWELKCSILLPTNSQNPKREYRETCCVAHHQARTNTQTKNPIQHDDLELLTVDYVSSNVKSSQFGAMLYIFEDNEAVIKMIIKGISPTMRHASRTHRVALRSLFDRIKSDTVTPASADRSEGFPSVFFKFSPLPLLPGPP